MKHTEKESCCVADQFCTASADMEGSCRPFLKSSCFACGEKVCVKCSTKRKYLKYGLKRLCNNCQTTHLDNGSDERIRRRLHKMAGVKYVKEKKMDKKDKIKKSLEEAKQAFLTILPELRQRAEGLGLTKTEEAIRNASLVAMMEINDISVEDVITLNKIARHKRQYEKGGRFEHLGNVTPGSLEDH